MKISIGKHFYMKQDPWKYYVVSFLLDEKSPQVVYKFFGIYKRYWNYEIESVDSFEKRFKCGLYFFSRNIDEN